MNDWILIAIAILTPVLSGAMAWGVNKQRWKFMDETIGAFRADHIKHFEHAKQAAAEMAALSQKVDDHDTRDDDRFGRIEDMFREIRDDLRGRR